MCIGFAKRDVADTQLMNKLANRKASHVEP